MNRTRRRALRGSDRSGSLLRPQVETAARPSDTEVQSPERRRAVASFSGVCEVFRSVMEEFLRQSLFVRATVWLSRTGKPSRSCDRRSGDVGCSVPVRKENPLKRLVFVFMAVVVLIGCAKEAVEAPKVAATNSEFSVGFRGS